MRKGKFRQLVRSENVCKPPLPFDKKELPATPSIDQKSESKNNTTMETTPEISCKLGSKEEEKVDKDEKYKDNLNVFNKFMLPEEQKRLAQDRALNTFTPGVTKRKLNRDVNTAITNPQKQDSKSRLPNLRIIKPPSDDDALLKPEDPLMKFSKLNRNKKEDKVKQSFNILQKLGGASLTPNKKEDSFDMFKIPDFKPKQKEMKDFTFKREEKKENKEQKENSSNSSLNFEELQKEVTEMKGMRKSVSVPMTVQPLPSKEKEFDKKLPTDFRRNSIASDQFKRKKRTVQNLRAMYGKKKEKILSVIHEENKGSVDVIVTDKVPQSPYFCDVIIGQDQEVLYHQHKSESSFETLPDQRSYLARVLKYYQMLQSHYELAPLAGKKRIDWKGLMDKPNIQKLLVQLQPTLGKDYLHTQLRKFISKLSKEDLVEMIKSNIEKFKQTMKDLDVKISKQKELSKEKENEKEESKGNDLEGTDKAKQATSPKKSHEDKESDEESSEEYSDTDSDSSFDPTAARKATSPNNKFSRATEVNSKAVSQENENKMQKIRFAEPVEVEEFSDDSCSDVASPRKLTRKQKSKFSSHGKSISLEKKDMLILGSNNKSKRDIKYDSGVGSQQFIKDANTVSLVSSLVDRTVRNNNLIEVFERLKFLSNECFRTKENKKYLFKMILNEVDLYLQSYDEEDEDSGWDSDEEVGVVKIAKNLKDAINEKSTLVDQLSQVERNLVQSNLNSVMERRSSIFASPMGDSGSATLKANRTDSHNTEDTSLSKEDGSGEKGDSVQNNLYKNVLKKKNPEGGENQEPISPAINLNFFDSDTTVGQKEDDSPVTPKAAGKKSKYHSRMAQRVNSSTFFGQRSSSIQSIRSNKSSFTNKKSKKSDGKGKHQKYGRRKGSSSSGSGSEATSRENSPKSALLISPNEGKSDTEGKHSKGLSSFAKKKAILKSRKGMGRLGRMKGKFNTKHDKIDKKKKLQLHKIRDDVSSNDESKKNVLAPLQEVSETDSPYVRKDGETIIKFPDEEVKLCTIQQRQPSIPIPLEKVKSKPEQMQVKPRLGGMTAMIKHQSELPPTEEEKESQSTLKIPQTEMKDNIKLSIDKDTFTPKVTFKSSKNNEMNFADEKRKSTIHQINAFNNIFDSFGSEDMKLVPKKERRSSIVLSARNTSSLALPVVKPRKSYLRGKSV